MIFQAGDQVRIRYFEKDKYPGWWTIGMQDMSGEILTIKEVSKIKNIALPYRLFNCIWGWKETDFEINGVIKKFKEDDFKL